MYATYNDYVTVYFGNSIEAEDFDKYATRASDYIDYLTMGKAKTYNDADGALAKACCAIAEQISLADTVSASVSVGGAEVASETVGSHSISYRSSAEVKAGLDAAMLTAAQIYLLPTGLLYRGVPCIRRIP